MWPQKLDTFVREGATFNDRGGKLTPTKARKILSDGEVRGHPLTKKQRGLFGAIARGKARKKGYK